MKYWVWQAVRGLAAPTIEGGKLTMDVERAIAELGVLIYPGAQMAAVHGLTDLFGVANRIAAEHQAAQLPLLRVSHWQVDGDQAPERVYDSHPAADGALVAVLIPPSIAGFSEGQAPQGLIRWLRQQHANGATLGGVCVGSILLAESGLLDGRSATTHWTSAKTFAERYPAIKLKADTPIVDDGDLITTAGLMAWSELPPAPRGFWWWNTATAQVNAAVIFHPFSAMEMLRFSRCSIGCRAPERPMCRWRRWPSGQGWKSARSCVDFVRQPGSNPPSIASTYGSAKPGKCSSSPTAPSITLPGRWVIRIRVRFGRPSRRLPGWRRVITGHGLG
jgi:hypothetical protein